MTETDTHTAAEAEENSPTISSPGQRLHRAREARGLSIPEAAVKLHLHQRMVVALEADDYEQLPSPIYVRGYLRNYARLVGVDPESIVAAYDNTDDQHPELKPPLKAPSQASSSDKPVKAVTYLITLGLVLLLLAWWQSRHISEQNLIDLDSMEIGESGSRAAGEGATEVDVPSETLGYPIKTVRHPDSPFFPLPSSGKQSAAGDGASTSTPAATGDATADMPVDTATTPAELLETMPDVSSGSETGAANGGESAAPETAGTGGDGLRLVLNKESWVEVYDATGKRLYLGLGKPGETIQVSGETPLRVLLGYAPGVEVTYNGETVDTVEHSQAGVAQFSVGQ